MEELTIGSGGYFVIAMMALATSMIVISLMMRLAPVVGMIDTPDPRKVHTIPIPRVGGLGIVIGAILPILIWLPFTDLTISILIGAVILLLFGTWDDIAELGHYVKFVGQFLAAGVVVYYGDLYISYFPLNNYETISESIGKPFTVIAIVGMINAINHSDGLDGLAGGESLISLGVIAYLAFLFDSNFMLIICAATAGGVFGFLRFNSHPARVFMGDGGSQFIGFMLAVLVMLLTQHVNTTLSPALPILLLGLPVIDILAVFFLRAKHKMNLFRATRNHVHHRLLDIGFLHYESVTIIYTVQLILVVSAIPLMYENDLNILIYYLFICGSVFVFLTVSERTGFKVHKDKEVAQDIASLIMAKHPRLCDVPIKAIEAGLSLFIIVSALVVYDVPVDFAISSLIMLLLLIFVLIKGFLGYHLYRLILFVTIGFSVYLLSTYPVDWLSDEPESVFIYYIIMSILAFIAVKTVSDDSFKISPLDYLVVVITIVIALLPGESEYTESIVWMFVQMIILFYVCEVLIQNMNSRLNRMTGSFVLALALIAYRGLV